MASSLVTYTPPYADGMASTTAASDSTSAEQDLNCIGLPDDSIIKGHRCTRYITPCVPAPDHMKRVTDEVKKIGQSLPDGIFVRYAEDQPAYLKALIVGPKGTPYEGGLFEFDLFCPPSYPLTPPLVRFCTTGGGRCSFNPNLYTDGFVCLSHIGTWGRSSWQKEYDIASVLVVLQACVLVEEPYLNEPGQEMYKGTQSSKACNRSIHPNTVKYAMLDWIEKRTNSQPVALGPVEKHHSIWDGVVGTHFMANKESILETVGKWLADRGPAPGGTRTAVIQGHELAASALDTASLADLPPTGGYPTNPQGLPLPMIPDAVLGATTMPFVGHGFLPPAFTGSPILNTILSQALSPLGGSPPSPLAGEHAVVAGPQTSTNGQMANGMTTGGHHKDKIVEVSIMDEGLRTFVESLKTSMGGLKDPARISQRWMDYIDESKHAEELEEEELEEELEELELEEGEMEQEETGKEEMEKKEGGLEAILTKSS